MRRLVLLPVLAACVFAGVPDAQASLVLEMDLAELSATAEQIIVADVAKVECQWDKGHRTIQSLVELRVQESWKGTPPGDGKMVLRQPGGSVGEIEMTVKGMAPFSVGERAVLFLDRGVVVGLGQGKRPVRWDPSSKRWMVAPTDTSSTYRFDRSKKTPSGSNRQWESLDDLRAKVRSLLEK